MTLILDNIAAPAGAPVVTEGGFQATLAADAGVSVWYDFRAGPLNTIVNGEVTRMKSRIDTEGAPEIVPIASNRHVPYESEGGVQFASGAAAGDFDDGALDVLTAPGFDLDGSFWFALYAKITAPGADGRNVVSGQNIIDNVPGGSFALQVSDDVSDEIAFRVGNGQGGSGEAVATLPITFGQETPIFCSWNASTRTAALSLDGVTWATGTGASAANGCTDLMIGAAINVASLGSEVGGYYPISATLASKFFLANFLTGAVDLRDAVNATTLANVRGLMQSSFSA